MEFHSIKDLGANWRRDTHTLPTHEVDTHTRYTHNTYTHICTYTACMNGPSNSTIQVQ